MQIFRVIHIELTSYPHSIHVFLSDIGKSLIFLAFYETISLDSPCQIRMGKRGR